MKLNLPISLDSTNTLRALDRLIACSAAVCLWLLRMACSWMLRSPKLYFCAPPPPSFNQLPLSPALSSLVASYVSCHVLCTTIPLWPDAGTRLCLDIALWCCLTMCVDCRSFSVVVPSIYNYLSADVRHLNTVFVTVKRNLKICLFSLAQRNGLPWCVLRLHWNFLVYCAGISRIAIKGNNSQAFHLSAVRSFLFCFERLHIFFPLILLYSGVYLHILW